MLAAIEMAGQGQSIEHHLVKESNQALQGLRVMRH